MCVYVCMCVRARAFVVLNKIMSKVSSDKYEISKENAWKQKKKKKLRRRKKPFFFTLSAIYIYNGHSSWRRDVRNTDFFRLFCRASGR